MADETHPFVAALHESESPNLACVWTQDNEGTWTAACEKAKGEDPSFTFFDGGPDENRFTFCPYCGRKLAAIYCTSDEPTVGNRCI